MENDRMTMFTEDELKKKVHEGYMVESVTDTAAAFAVDFLKK